VRVVCNRIVGEREWHCVCVLGAAGEGKNSGSESGDARGCQEGFGFGYDQKKGNTRELTAAAMSSVTVCAHAREGMFSSRVGMHIYVDSYRCLDVRMRVYARVGMRIGARGQVCAG